MTYEQKLIVGVIDRLCGDVEYRQLAAGGLLGVNQTSICRYLTGDRSVRPSVVRLAETLLVVCKAGDGIVKITRRDEIEALLRNQKRKSRNRRRK